LIEPETAYAGLEQIARNDDIRIADSVIQALVVLSMQGQLESIICSLDDWITEGTNSNGLAQERQIVCMIAIRDCLKRFDCRAKKWDSWRLCRPNNYTQPI
jgi:hypothetical protein